LRKYRFKHNFGYIYSGGFSQHTHGMYGLIIMKQIFTQKYLNKTYKIRHIMIYFIIFAVSSASLYALKDNIQSLLRIFNKILYPKLYNIPVLSQYDFPLPPFPNTWYPICLSTDLQKNTLRKEKIAGKEFILYRGSNGVAYAIPDKCSHMGVDLIYGRVENDCVICPFHNKCNKPKDNPDDEKMFIEECNNVIFIWIGVLHNGIPFKSMADLTKKYTEPEKYMFSFPFLKRAIGGHLIDYAEHLLDTNHTQSIHGVTIDTKYTSIETANHSFSIRFKIEDSYITPNFTYITPTFGFVEYTENIKVYIMFVVRTVGYIEMVILPNGNTIQKLAYSFLGALYTQLDFADEAAFFSTKNHNIRNLLPNEAPIQCFREWFTYTFYTSAQLDDFMKCKKLNDW